MSSPKHPAPHDGWAGLRLLIIRLHFYIGLFVAPFIFFAALTGTAYVLAPQIETALYHDTLFTTTTGTPQPLSAQAAAARAFIGPEPRLFSLRPAPAAGQTSRVMFTQPGLPDSETRTVFVDPVTLAVHGELRTYGTSGVLPLRLMLDYLHRHGLLGDLGRNYSELAASWLWVAVISGVVLWSWTRRSTNHRPVRRLHSLIGLWCAIGLLFLSVTGLTWSKWAGDHIDALRGTLGWVTPSVSTTLTVQSPVSTTLTAPASAPAPAVAGDHADHAGQHAGGQGMPMTAPQVPRDPLDLLDPVLAAAQAGGIDSPKVEVRPAKTASLAWVVREYDRSWPTQVDTVAIDPATLTITSRADFATFPLVAKLVRWGIDTHMGVLFGVPNQLLMAALGIGLMVMIAYGYRLWWLRRPPAGAPARVLLAAWARLGGVQKLLCGLIALVLGWALPVLGASLLAFLLIDAVRWWRSARRRVAA
ncbi:PepSY-associated TM helix domain-containing protein [Insolitispirillum peregrinum]|uniref:Uncharacterized iron-regulated membrane protein n=1 Tax=Insolitispirillum peregrinum TaxID=80876 RepID=A0A1N7Q994_9PROT|nr:PepSY-associated TM helix domain-containing protein [Insolitispirillum peregrinum]SIT19394.1 Uncharacterized iron-regulated membrane protein [Insolitispirillum peregrinum]